MITQPLLDALQTTLQAAYVAAGSACEVLSDWPDPAYDPPHPYIVLAEGDEVDAMLGNGMRGNPSPPAYAYDPDIVFATYRQRAVHRQPGPPTIKQAQDAMRADKLVLLGIFKPGTSAIHLGGACLEAGKLIRVRHPRTGPYDEEKNAPVVRFTWQATITIRASNH